MSKFKEALGDTPYPASGRIAYRGTSRSAWQSFMPVSAELDRAILAKIDAAGETGIICEEIETSLARKHAAVSGNLRHLAEKGLVEASGNFGLTISNRKAIKWRLSEKARGS